MSASEVFASTTCENLRASEAYALKEANITRGAIQAKTATDPLCIGLVQRGYMRQENADTMPWECKHFQGFAEAVSRTFFITDAGREALMASKVLRNRIGYNRGDWASLYAKGE